MTARVGRDEESQESDISLFRCEDRHDCSRPCCHLGRDGADKLVHNTALGELTEGIFADLRPREPSSKEEVGSIGVLRKSVVI